MLHGFTISPAVTGGVTERFGGGAPKVTMSGGAAITAGRLVELSGNRTVIQAAATSTKVVGVAIQDYDGTAATGNKLAVATGGVWNLRAGGAIAAGDLVVAAANGTVVALAAAGAAYVQGEANATRAIVGVALEAISNGADGPVLLKVAA